MKHIVVLVGSYHPNYSAVGNCAKNIIDELKKESKVTVVAYKTFYRDVYYEKFEGYEIYRVDTWLKSIYLYCDEKVKTNNIFLKSIFLFLKNCIRSIRYLNACCQKVNIQWDFVNAFEKKLLEIDFINKIDALLCFSFPFESVVAGLSFKEKKPVVKFIPFLFDNFVEGIALHRTKNNVSRKWNNHIKLLEKVIFHADKVFAMHPLKNHFTSYYSSEILNKISFKEHPLLIRFPLEKLKKFNNNIVISYTGSFIKDYIEPDYLLNVFDRLINRAKNIKLNFYVMGNCLDGINNFVKLHADNVINHGFIPQVKLIDVLVNSNILISVSEVSGVQISSKIFQYISTGNPILLFYYTDEDINMKILSKYPLALFIKCDIDIIDENVEIMSNFIIDNKDKRISFEEVEEYYKEALPSNSANEIFNIVYN